MTTLRQRAEVQLGSLCASVTVGYVSTMAHQYRPSGVRFLRSQDIGPFNIDTASVKYIDDAFDAKLKKSRLSAGDVVIVRTGYPGTAAVVPPGLHGANCADLVILRPGPSLDPWFVASLFNSAWGRGAVAGNLVGVAQQHFNVGAAKTLRVRLPSLREQRRVGEIIKGYCDLIENNTRRIAILEEMAWRIFEEWFVRFRAPGFERAPRIGSPLGPIPKGWSVQRLDAVMDFDPRTDVNRDGMKVFVPMDSLQTGSMFVLGPGEREATSGAKFKNGDTLLARITPCLENGKTGYVDILAGADAVGVGSTEFIVMRGRLVPPEYVQILARSEPFRAHAIKSMGGADGRQRVRRDSLEQFQVALPTRETLKAFSVVVSPMFKLGRALTNANSNLRAQRDLLLPKLISGEINVSSASTLKEAAE